MDKHLNPFYSTSTAILLGSIIIAAAILMHGGIIQVGKFTNSNAKTSTVTAPTRPNSTAQPAQPAENKSEAEIVNNLKAQAQKVGLDQAKFNACLDSNEKAELVKADLNDGQAAGVSGTPAFFINGLLIPGAVPFSQFKKTIDEELSGSASDSTERKTVAVGNLPILGQASAPVTIIEFSDYQCPFCERFYTQTEGQIKKEYIDSGKVKFYYRDFPLSQIHPGAQKAAEAARCAGDQDKYWQYHDIVFQNQSEIF